MRYLLSLAAVLAAVWLLWSGHYTGLLLSFGAGSVALSLLLSRRMGLIDAEGAPIDLPLKMLRYYPWLIKEIVLSNIDVAWRILHPALPIRPNMIEVPASQKTDLWRVLYANSITLTPGTVSVELTETCVVVHALTLESAAALEEGTMDRKLAKLENPS